MPVVTSSALGHLFRRMTHLVTGATGFVGAAIALELLERTSDDLVAIVRPGKDSALARFRQALVGAARAYDRALDVDAALARCRVVAGDVARHCCGITDEHIGHVTQVWHCAASLRYEDRFAAEITACNVDGTRNVLALAGALGAECFNYVSTAYVAGRRGGRVREEVLTDAVPNNCYEATKQAAERLVLASDFSRVRIFRPSVVVGHTRTLGATTFSGYYGFIRQMVQFRGMTERVQRGLLAGTPVRLRIDPDGTIDLVPIDTVAREAVTLGLGAEHAGIYHLTHAAPPPIELAVRTVFALLGLHEPLFVREREELGWLDQKLDDRLEFYRSYIMANRTFDRSRTDAALGRTRIAAPNYDAAAIAALGRWYLDHLQRERAALPVAR
ncbi:MAG TPA: SDR family oxidoreductase [Nannocystaceae bacterium]|nr:SDR family oxidoreductase [Nannocystaceae bacterium]